MVEPTPTIPNTVKWWAVREVSSPYTQSPPKWFLWEAFYLKTFECLFACPAIVCRPAQNSFRPLDVLEFTHVGTFYQLLHIYNSHTEVERANDRLLKQYDEQKANKARRHLFDLTSMPVVYIGGYVLSSFLGLRPKKLSPERFTRTHKNAGKSFYSTCEYWQTG